MEIVVDAYGEEERAMGWYYYLADKLQFPFKATCIAERTVSPLSVGDLVEVVKMAPEDDYPLPSYHAPEKPANTGAAGMTKERLEHIHL